MNSQTNALNNMAQLQANLNVATQKQVQQQKAQQEAQERLTAVFGSRTPDEVGAIIENAQIALTNTTEFLETKSAEWVRLSNKMANGEALSEQEVAQLEDDFNTARQHYQAGKNVLANVSVPNNQNSAS